MWRLFIMIVMFGTPADAGAWLRDQGAGFLSFATTAKHAETYFDPMTYSSAYLEYGVTPRLTLGADLGYDDLGQYKAILFVTQPLRTPMDTWRSSYEMGFGAINNAFVLRPGLSLGRGLSFGETSGWFTVDARADILPETGRVMLASDVTLGLSPQTRSKVIFQLQAGGEIESPPYIRLAPSFVYEMKEGRHLEIGVTAGVSNAERYGVKLGIWRFF